jgi:predicted TIM-barrel fold metal-dependent hydrolase
VIDYLDAHVHPPVAAFFQGPLHRYLEGMEARLESGLRVESAESIADYYRSRNARAIVLGWDTESVTDRRPLGNADIASVVAAAPDIFVGFGAADPTKGAAAVVQVHEAAGFGLAGLAFHPNAQGIGPADRYASPVWEAAADHDLICLFHTGFTDLGAGQLGGAGIRLGHGRPISVDGVAAEYPSMRIVMAHAGSVWLEEAVAVALHKRNVWLDLSGQLPGSMPPVLVEAIRGPLRDRCLFGSRYPFGSPEDWLAEWAKLEMPDEVSRAVRHENAEVLLREVSVD